MKRVLWLSLLIVFAGASVLYACGSNSPVSDSGDHVEHDSLHGGESNPHGTTQAVSYTVSRKFPEGFQVQTRLWALPPVGAGKAHGEVFSISLPDAGTLSKTITYYINIPAPIVNDGGGEGKEVDIEPTLTGTVILEPDDFGGEFPESLTLQVQWRNDTPETAYTPANSRQMSVMIVPLNAEH